jgi:hypothetical protein
LYARAGRGPLSVRGSRGKDIKDSKGLKDHKDETLGRRVLMSLVSLMSVLDLQGKIEFAPGYEYKMLRSR